ncbi:tyrosine-type recombinase/integrase [Thermodesulfobacteriota bacterium]
MPEKLTPTKVLKLTPRVKRFDIFDTEQKGFGVRVFPSGRKSYFYIYHQAGRKRRYTIGDASKLKLQQARDIIIIKAGEVASGDDPGAIRKAKRAEAKTAKGKTVGGFFELHYAPWLESERKSGEATKKRLERCFEWLFAKPMTEVSPFLIQGWRKKRLEAGRSPHTVNRDTVAFKAMLSKAVEWGFLATHPLANLKRTKADDNSRVRYLSPDEVKRLLTALDKREANGREARQRFNEWRQQRHLALYPEIFEEEFIDHLKPLVFLALNTGLRRGELFNLEWTDIDFIHHRLTVRAAAAKGAKTRHIPLNATARDVLNRWHNQTSEQETTKKNGLVFPGSEGKRLDNISTSWRKLITDAKIEDFTFHDLRHDFATKTLKAGADIVTVSKLLGHSDLKMTLRYSHVTDETLTAAVERLPANG